jgi:ribosome-associated protein
MKPEDLLLDIPEARIPLDEVEFRASRSSGPGGQHANVTASRIEAILDLETCSGLSEAARERAIARFGTRVSAIAQDTRSQLRNRELAAARLAERLTEALAVKPPRRPTRPSRGARERVREAKRRQSERKNTRRPPTIE